MCEEATARGYAFDRSKVGAVHKVALINVTRGQLEYEWEHLLRKLAVSNPAGHRKWHVVRKPECHPLFRLRPGGVASWERTWPALP